MQRSIELKRIIFSTYCRQPYTIGVNLLQTSLCMGTEKASFYRNSESPRISREKIKGMPPEYW